MGAKKFQKFSKIFKIVSERGAKPDFMRLCARLKILARLSQYEYIPLLSAESLIKIGVGRIDFYFIFHVAEQTARIKRVGGDFFDVVGNFQASDNNA